MPNTPDILKLRILLCFLRAEPNTCTVTGIARTLGEEKYTVSRIIIALEKEGFIDRSNVRHPILTEKGRREANYYAERIDITLNHLIYEGVDTENAQNDALYWALYNSDKTMDTIRAMQERCRVKCEFRGIRQFGGAAFCKKINNGVYQFPFLIYREHVLNKSNLSMANEGFEHPCTMRVENGQGTILLRAVNLTAKSAANGDAMRGKVRSLQYFADGDFIHAEANGDILSLPVSALNFINIGEGSSQVLHGSVCLKMKCSVGVSHMPESTAIFTVLI